MIRISSREVSQRAPAISSLSSLRRAGPGSLRPSLPLSQPPQWRPDIVRPWSFSAASRCRLFGPAALAPLAYPFFLCVCHRRSFFPLSSLCLRFFPVPSSFRFLALSFSLGFHLVIRGAPGSLVPRGERRLLPGLGWGSRGSPGELPIRRRPEFSLRA